MPKTFKDGIKEDICAEIAKGQSLIKVCKIKGMPNPKTVYQWLKEDEIFCNDYARAREERAERHFEECLEIADSATSENVQSAKLQIDTRKWMLGKMAPKTYGDKVDLVSSDGSMSPQPLPWAAMYDKKGDGGNT